MRDTPRWIHIGLGVLAAVVMSTLIYLVVSGPIVGRPWWLTLGAGLALPEITRGALAEFGSSQMKGTASQRNTRRAMQTLSVAGMLLMIAGVASL